MLSVITSNSLWIQFLRLLLLSSAILSMAEILKFYAPVVADILVSDVPAVWSSIILWLRPPYLYLLVNFIIISILASSRLHQYLVDPPPMAVPKLCADSRADFTVRRAVGDVLEKSGSDANEDLAADVSEDEGKSEAELYSKVSDRENDESGKADRSRLQKEDSMENLSQKYDKKPPISSKIGNRKAAKAATTPSGTTSRRSTMYGHDTLDDAWNAITEGHSSPFLRRLDKSDTWESHTTRDEEETAIGQNNSPTKVTKSETSFNSNDKNQELSRSAAAVRVRKMPSVTEEELKRRVEAFIEKFKEEMRLQREESLKRFELMINGSYY